MLENLREDKRPVDWLANKGAGDVVGGKPSGALLFGRALLGAGGNVAGELGRLDCPRVNPALTPAYIAEARADGQIRKETEQVRLRCRRVEKFTLSRQRRNGVVAWVDLDDRSAIVGDLGHQRADPGGEAVQGVLVQLPALARV
ncbi:hypothetical protein D7044_14595 [Micromonospora musae]|uniref:Uncharacterized protein n=1 Tax=Micromonospora musae TaxID=1894970 RepID=A0A3A9YIQ8_9ACTN|nr:hypothetical protein D7044_14595 [Micromonospora musae]